LLEKVISITYSTPLNYCLTLLTITVARGQKSMLTYWFKWTSYTR